MTSDDSDDDTLSSTEQQSLFGTLFKPRAVLGLFLPSSSVAQTSTTGWALSKTGRVDDDLVTWQINATPSGTPKKTLGITGKVIVLNIGTTPAPIGNIVVNLEAKTGTTWTTVASNVATAAHGDAATAATIVNATDYDADADNDDQNPWANLKTYSEGPGSGTLSFTRGATTPWSITPKQAVNAFSTLDLRFAATFDNTALNLATGQAIRAVIIVSSGNAGTGFRTFANVDLDGNGSISADEARVRSKARQLGSKTVPAPTDVSSAVAISDTAADLTTTGTVTVTNPAFALGATTGTASVTVRGGADGGTVTNCAHLTGTSVTACDTQAIAPERHEWTNGEVVTYDASQWGGTPGTDTAATLLVNNFSNLYSSVVIGIFPAGFYAVFTSAQAVLDFIPTPGAPAAFTTNYSDPTTTNAGAFAGEVLALQLNVDFADAELTGASFAPAFGDLTVCALTTTPAANSTKVRDVLATANQLIGAAPGPYSVSAAFELVRALNVSFVNGTVSAYARDHLVVGSCP